MARHVLISSLRNEGPFILEWVAHHRVVGFDGIYVASNSCTDGSDTLLDALQAAGVLIHVPNPVAPGEIPQHSAYARIRATHPVDRADWLAALDTDEFLNIHIRHNRLADLTEAAAGADIISLSARNFSDLPQTHWQPGPVTRAFPMALRAAHRANTAIKTLTHAPARFRGMHNHHMVGFSGEGPLRVFAAQTGTMWTLTPGSPDRRKLRFLPMGEIGHQIAQINHYSIKTWDSFQLRQQRGRGATPEGRENTRHTATYFACRSGRGRAETSILRYAEETDRLVRDLLAEPAIARAQAACEAAYAAALQGLAPMTGMIGSGLQRREGR